MRAAASSRLGQALRSDFAFGACVLAAMGITFAAVGFPRSAPGAGLAAIALAIARADGRARIIPNLANLAAAVLALIEASMSEAPLVAEIDALARGASVFLAFLAFRSLFRFWRGREGMGLGDVKLAGVLGLWLDWPYIPIAVEMACLSAIAWVVALRVVFQRPFDSLAKLPFGAFLAPAVWVAWMGENILS